MRLIDADALARVLQGVEEYLDGEGLTSRADGVRDAIMDVHDAPTIEPERKKGQWIHEIKHHKSEEQEFDYYEIRCSECGVIKKIGWHGANYCPNCGSYNGGEKDGEDAIQL